MIQATTYDATKYKTPTGTKLSCRGWIQEAALRMLLNNLNPDVAEKPDELIVYGGRGKAARNFEALIGLMDQYWENMMFCSDDKHPDSLELGHINVLVKRALAKGIDLYKVLTAACLNPIESGVSAWCS